jgi:hypothetical protein
MSLFYLSFADSSRPKGKQFLGALIVRASHMTEAISASHALGLNPGGEVVGHPVKIQPGFNDVPEAYIEKLLSAGELSQMEREMMVGDGGSFHDEG